jgi:hypothetical protein
MNLFFSATKAPGHKVSQGKFTSARDNAYMTPQKIRPPILKPGDEIGIV